VRKVILILGLTLIMATTAYSQGLGLYSITAKGGLILPDSPWDSGFEIGAKADMGEIFENVRLNPVVEYWSASYGIAGFDLDLTNFQIGAEAHYAVAKVKGLYVGAGLVLNFVSFDFPGLALIGGTSSISNTDFGVTVLGGFEFPLGGMTGVAEAKYNLTDVSAFGITFGVKFDMKK